MVGFNLGVDMEVKFVCVELGQSCVCMPWCVERMKMHSALDKHTEGQVVCKQIHG